MKKLIGVLVLIVIGLLVSPTSVSAHEGIVDLTSSSVSCKGVSIYQDGNYKVTGRCDGLVYPYQTLYNKYVLWGKTTVRGEMVRIAEVDKGYFSGYIGDEFDGVYITAEKDGLVRKASDMVIVSGRVAPFSFDKSQVTTAPTTSTTTTTPATTSKTSTATTASTSTSTAGAVIGKIVSSLLVVILVIVGLAIGASLIFRSRGSVSAQ
jgi:hypothetical protein